MKTLLLIIPFALCFGVAVTADEISSVAPEVKEAERVLEFQHAKKKQIRHTMIGLTSTQIFYTYDAQKAVLVVHIDNASADFKTSGKLAVFSPDTDAKAIARWVNNQYSDGLYMDAAKPMKVHQLPKTIGSVIQSERTGVEKHHTTQKPYGDYKVRIAIKEHRVEGDFKLEAFEDDANVFLKEETL